MALAVELAWLWEQAKRQMAEKDAELVALRARVAALEAEVAALRATATAPPWRTGPRG